MIRFRPAIVLSIAVVAFACASPAVAADHAAAVAPFGSDDTFAVIGIDLAAIDPPALVEALIGSADWPAEDKQQYRQFGAIANGLIASCRAAGVRYVYAVVGLGDLYSGPLFVAMPESADRADAVEASLNAGVQTLALLAGERRGPQPRVGRHASGAVMLALPGTFERYAERSTDFSPSPNERTEVRGTARADLADALATKLDDGAAIGAVFSPGPDFRRVVRELWPELPGKLAPLRGELVDRWQRWELTATLPPETAVRCTLHAADPDAAALFARLLRDVPAGLGQLEELGERRSDVERHLARFIDAVTIEVDGSRATVALPTDREQLAGVRESIAEAADAAWESTRRAQRFNQLRQLAIAMHNYHDTNQHLPPPAIYDADGRPLLSWRVAILPYIEERGMFREFRLDEPWDSPHNRALIEKMPSMYADPHPRLRRLAREGKTTFQLPVGPETVFHSPEGTTFREITDGTSMTMMIVEVEPSRAVIWTKPDDWEVDLDHPRRGVERTDRPYFQVAFCDGSAHALPVDMEESRLRALVTRAGGEVIRP